MKTTIILALFCSLFVGCRPVDSASEKDRVTPESVAKKAEQLTTQIGRIMQIATRSDLVSPEILRSLDNGQVAWGEYQRAEQKQRVHFAASGVVLDGEYYRLQGELLDAFSRQWEQIEKLLAKTP
jgi:hypothetical protein